MKNLFLSFVACSLLLVSCSKSSTGPSNNWKLGTTSYDTKYSIADASSQQLICMDATPSGSNPAVNDCIVTFHTLPTAGGTYKIKSSTSASLLAADEVNIVCGIYSPGASYITTGNDNISATVTVSGGKDHDQYTKLLGKESRQYYR